MVVAEQPAYLGPGAHEVDDGLALERQAEIFGPTLVPRHLCAAVVAVVAAVVVVVVWWRCGGGGGGEGAPPPFFLPPISYTSCDLWSLVKNKA